MTAGQMKTAVATAIEEAHAGVDYTARHGAVCPWCGRKRIPTYRTMPWGEGGRVRYHHCPHKGCLLHEMGVGVKSVQEEG
jgi:hypothetical protein